MKTKIKTFGDNIRHVVYILPLRNENTTILDQAKFINLCLYPTFKEWKRMNESATPVYLIPFISYL